MGMGTKICAPVVGVLACLAGGEALAQDRAQGRAVYELWCAPCHKPLSPEDQFVAGTGVLERKYHGTKPAALEQQADLTPGDLRGADEAFLSSTAGGIMPVSHVDGKPLGSGKPGPLSMQVRALYWEKREAGWKGTGVKDLLTT